MIFGLLSRWNSGKSQAKKLWKSIKNAYPEFRARHALNAWTRIDLYESLADFTEDGTPLKDALETLHDEYTVDHSPLATMTQSWLEASVEKGAAVDRIRGWIPDNEMAMIESSATALDPIEQANGFRAAAAQAEMMADAVYSMRKATFNPAMGFFGVIICLFFFHYKMVPLLLKWAPLDRWPWYSQAFKLASDILAFGWPLILAVVTMGILAVRWSIQHSTGNMRRMLDHIPPWSVVRRVYESSFLRSMSSLLKNGKPFMDSLALLQTSSTSTYLRWHIGIMILNVHTLKMREAQALNTGLLSPRMATKIAGYAKRGKLDNAIMSAGERTGKYTLRYLEKLSEKMGFWALIVVASLVGSMYISFLEVAYENAGSAFK